jgi:hypothetical protein
MDRWRVKAFSRFHTSTVDAKPFSVMGLTDLTFLSD